MESQLRPGEDLAEFFQGAEAAGQRDKTIGKLGHEGFAFVHRIDDAQILDAAMRQFAGDEGLRDHSDNVPSPAQHCISHRAHQPDVTTAIDKLEVAPRENFAHERRGRGVNCPRPTIRAAKDANALHQRLGAMGCS